MEVSNPNPFNRALTNDFRHQLFPSTIVVKLPSVIHVHAFIAGYLGNLLDAHPFCLIRWLRCYLPYLRRLPMPKIVAKSCNGKQASHIIGTC